MTDLREGPRGRLPVARLRVRARLTLEQAAQAAGITSRQWFNIEHALKQPRPATLSRCAAAVGVTDSAFYNAILKTRNASSPKGNRPRRVAA